ncbi:adenosine kinase [Candidatus Woesearchaeota archaeon]|nr:MAG: adenosine kinase [Candidatus Woesearchaeota archaeon]
MQKDIDVVGIGNPLMDIIVKIEDHELEELDLKKGTMNLVDAENIKKFEEKILKKDKTLVPGGSVANTLAAMALLGAKVVFVGKIGEDEHGDVYEQKLIGGNILSRVKKANGETGRVISLVTPDSERTFATYLGVCTQLEKEELAEEDIKKAKVLHLTGYQLEEPKLRETSLHAIKIAKDNKTKVSIDLADPELVKRNKEQILEIIKQADILFANEKEIAELTGKKPEEAVTEFPWIETLAVKMGAKGSIVRHKGSIIKEEGVKAKAVDTTGAGDMYAAVILYGLTHDKDMTTTVRAANHAAGKVVETIGARLERGWEEIKGMFS